MSFCMSWAKCYYGVQWSYKSIDTAVPDTTSQLQYHNKHPHQVSTVNSCLSDIPFDLEEATADYSDKSVASVMFHVGFSGCYKYHCLKFPSCLRDGCGSIEEQPFLGYIWLWLDLLVVAVSFLSVIQMPRLGKILIIFGHTWSKLWPGSLGLYLSIQHLTNTGFGSYYCSCLT